MRQGRPGAHVRTPLFLLALLACTPKPVPAPVAAETPAPALPELDVPFEQFTLDNGLRVVVHEDHKAPIVAVNIWYHVGSKDEPVGRSGFAHLFEHLMFQGTENFQGEYFEPFQRVGATDMNGTTSEDRTNYFENVPTPALDVALWMESDRMGHFVGSVTQELLDEQRGVVQNEKRQGLNQPYGKVYELVPEYAYPEGHPYAHSVIGSMEDLDAASLSDVQEWFATWYGPSNAVLVLAGDITPDEARAKVELYFGDIEPGPELERPAPWTAPLTEPVRLSISDEVPLARVYRLWNVPAWLDADERRLHLVMQILGNGKNSRMFQRLVYTDELATEIEADLWAGELGSQVWISATAREGVSLAELEAALDAELERLRTDGVTDEEVARAKMQVFSDRVRELERVGGFGGKSDLLARSLVLGGSPDAWATGDDTLRAATATEVSEAARTWLTDASLTLEVHPADAFDAEAAAARTEPRPAIEGHDVPMVADVRTRELAAVGEGADRSALPVAGTPPDLRLPPMQRTTLSNGMEVVLAERHEAPLVRAHMFVRAGFAADPAGRSGTAKLTMSMLDEGTADLDALGISARLEDLGASVYAGSATDSCQVGLSTLSTTLEPALELYADIVRAPSFPAEELERQRKQVLARIQQEQSSPAPTAFRLLGPLMFGDGHGYGVPLTGSGTPEVIADLSRDELVTFHETWFRPDEATLVVVGDTTLATLTPLLEDAFGSWTAPDTEVPEKNVGPVEPPEAARIYLVDKPNAEQTVLIGGLLAPPRSELDLPLELMNGVLGGKFTSRLNMNLREDKHWSYGAYSFIAQTHNQRLLALFAGVQTDKTAESLAELQAEVRAITGDRPPTEAEVARLKDGSTLELPGNNETGSELLGSVAEVLEYELPETYWQDYVSAVRGLPLEAVAAAAQAVILPDQVVWIAVGDLEKIRGPLEALDIAPVEVLEP